MRASLIGAAVVLALAAGLAVGIWRGRGEVEAPPPFAPDRTENGTLEMRGGVPVLFLSGPPRARGLAHGRLLADAIRGWVERVRPAGPGLSDFAISTCGERLLPFVPPDVREEMEGIAEGAGVSLKEILHLHTRLEIETFETPRRPRFLGPAAAGAGPAVARWFSPDDVDGRPGELVVVVHRVEPPIALVALPGMAGGFLGVRGETGATLRPMEAKTPAVLGGLTWPLLLRELLRHPPEAGRPLPARATLLASLPMALPGGRVGALNVAPSGGTWYRAPSGVAAASEDAVTGTEDAVDLAAGEAPHSPPALPLGRHIVVRMTRRGAVVEVSFEEAGEARKAEIELLP
ncbi:MAG: hypothetical protein ACREID_03525 [Planctomycetota bacterium]